MSGRVMGEAAAYRTTGSFVLGGQFFVLHMIDTASPPAYEASVYFGVDSSMNEVVAHWLDSFGGAGARVVGFGTIAADSMVVIYPYASARFRNTFLFRDTETWSLVIESESSDGGWVHFASYMAVRRP
ncbi:MAG: hypothetical protein MUE68_04060 [Bacteroidetes bacterium]|nr:hypothetical protein [Bacteroidota bacterium]